MLPVTAVFIAIAALTLAGLLAISRPASPRERLALGIAAGVGVGWLIVPGAAAEQLFRAAAVIAVVTFALLTLWTNLSLVHRSLAAGVAGLAAVSTLLPAVGSSWGALSWALEHRAGVAARVVVSGLWGASESGGLGLAPAPEDLERWFTTTVRMLGTFFPALAALLVVAALAFGAHIYYRVARLPKGRLPEPFRHFRFSDHLGWAAVAALVAVLVPKLAAAKAAASNVLLVTAALYALRGAAVMAFVVDALGLGGVLFSITVAVILFLLLPVVAGSAIVLGVLDAGLDLRTRWSQRPRSD
jgi:hypothetical protein